MKLIRTQKSLNVIKFYAGTIIAFPYSSIALITLGVFYRLLNVIIFVTVIKIFLLIIDSNTANQLLKLAANYHPILTEIPHEKTPLLALSLLFIMAITLYLVGTLYLKIMLKVRAILLKNGVNINIYEKLVDKRNFALDHFAAGYDSIIKLSEIFVFFCLLAAIIFIINKMLFITIVVLVPLIVIWLVYKGKESIFIQTKFRNSRQAIGRKTEAEYSQIIKDSNQFFASSRRAIIKSDFSTGIGMVAVIGLFFAYQPENISSNLQALILVFSVRFAIMYAKESSVVLGRLLQQRTIIDNHHVKKETLIKE